MRRVFEQRGMTVTVQYANAEAAGRHAEVRRIIGGGLNSYIELFGGLPRDSVGRSHGRLRVELSIAPRGEGDADPGLVRVAMGREPMLGFYTWQMTLLHELFHLWSAESFRYNTDEEQWFNEGAAEFYTLQTAARLGLMRKDQVPATFAIPVTFYSSALDAGRMSMRKAGSTPALKRDHYFLVYHGGLTAVLSLDYEIRRRSQGQRSMNDVMRWLYRSFDAQARRYTTKDIERGAKETTGVDIGDFLGRYVSGSDIIPVGRYFSLGETALSLARNPVLPADQRRAVDPLLAASLGLSLKP
ncbi:MAG: hypothetical protein ACREMA_03435 [Longimicrobiales bacterium]